MRFSLIVLQCGALVQQLSCYLLFLYSFEVVPLALGELILKFRGLNVSSNDLMFFWSHWICGKAFLTEIESRGTQYSIKQ
ncbi:hypothetical protein MRB53_022837 [Persea americana]|uniref:Uncharacterized protein n=1 Tax=Persea americana TaxID=3435 RepID=A0ACC2L7R1_PERAE|nr:hypothetical protein MRB53_022837 [Persea americana]